MRSDDELQDLAASIKANGQRQPITLDSRGTLLDGRNRLAACQIAGIAPVFTTLSDDQDPIAFIVDMNLGRRDLIKSQHAMLYAVAYPEPNSGILKIPPVRKQLISFARTVIREFGVDSPEVSGILGGGSLNEAYDWVLARRKAKEDFEVLQAEQRQAALEAEQELERVHKRVYLATVVEKAIQWFKDTYTTHPAADCWPLMLRGPADSDDNAEGWWDFVESIRDHGGLIHPITHGTDGRIIDGRLRLIGCHLAGVEPRFKTLPEGIDPDEYVINANGWRKSYTVAEYKLAKQKSKERQRLSTFLTER